MVKTPHMKVAKYDTSHKGVDKLIQSAESVERWIPSKIKVLFVVGDGDFRAKKGFLPSGILMLPKKVLFFASQYLLHSFE
jgi:hypothetical protein